MLQKIKELLEKNDKIGIAVSKNPGIDEMGAALSLYLSLRESGKKVTIVCPTEPIVELSSLVAIDEVKSNFGASKSGDLVVSFPDKGDIAKISYTRENGFLNIVVTAAEQGLSFDENDVRYTRGTAPQEVIFAIGMPLISDLEKLVNITALKDTKIINIDNKAENQGYGDIPLVSKNLSSVSEEVASIILSLGLKIDIDIAQNLLFGIDAGTDSFQNPNTTSLAFEMAAILMKKGAVRKKAAVRKSEIQNEDAYSFFAPPPKQPKLKQVQPIAREDNNPPADWLAPKIYKGSTSI